MRRRQQALSRLFWSFRCIPGRGLDTPAKRKRWIMLLAGDRNRNSSLMKERYFPVVSVSSTHAKKSPLLLANNCEKLGGVLAGRI